jgi:2-(1,2-epoxy-1,2-dihydrophenyl)acetyl-CoA isomerase
MSDPVEDGPRAEMVLDGGIARLTLTRPPHNAIDQRMAEDLLTAVRRIRGSEDARVVLLTAEGRNFSVGGDLAFLRGTEEQLPTVLDEMIARYHEVLAILAELTVPVIGAMQGAVAGGALGLLWSADTVIVADDFKLTPAFTAIGASGDGGSSWYLPRLLGLRRAIDLLYSGRTVGAAEALDLGLVSRVVALADLGAAAEEEADRMAHGPTRAYGAIRQLYRQGFSRTLREQLAHEQTNIVATLSSDDGRHGMTAFAERRPPAFTGR